LDWVDTLTLAMVLLKQKLGNQEDIYCFHASTTEICVDCGKNCSGGLSLLEPEN